MEDVTAVRYAGWYKYQLGSKVGIFSIYFMHKYLLVSDHCTGYLQVLFINLVIFYLKENVPRSHFSI